MATYDPLDFELEEPIRNSPSLAKRKKKLIGLDDLLEDHEKEQKKLNERKSKKKKIQKVCDEEEVDDAKEAQLSKFVDKCQKEINQINGDVEMPSWGIQLFGDKEELPQQEKYPQLKNSLLLQACLNNKINSLVELDIGKGENFLGGLLVNGWLLHLSRASGHVDKSIATWTFNLMLYSSKIKLMEAAYEFWCNILSHNDKASSTIKIDWLPGYSDLKSALQIYGFRMDSPPKFSSDDMIPAGTPQNIQCWIKCAALFCQIRNANIVCSTQEAEDLLVILTAFFLDRQLLGLSVVLYDAIISVISFFRDEEWPDSCRKVARSLARSLPCDINCLRVVESFLGVNRRSKQLRSAVAFHFLLTCLDDKECDAEEILRLMISINVKEKSCDLLKMYICLSLVENWLSFDTMLEDKSVLRELWGVCLRNCSSGITITDLRSYASNVRSKASYLLQGNTSD